MPSCSHCRRRFWFWKKDLLGSLCPLCREQKKQADDRAARERENARKFAFEHSGKLRRVWVGSGRGALFGTLGIVAIGFSVLAATSGPGVRYPFERLSLAWMLSSLAVVGLAVLIGWLTTWYFGFLALVAIGLVGGAIVGGIRGWQGQWEVFA